MCNRCELLLTHTIIAMVGSKVVKVHCNTCGTDHAYRATPGARSARTAPAAAPRHPDVRWETRVAGRDPASAKKYSPKNTYQVNDLIDHPNFGLGVVIVNRSDKIDVVFKVGEKTLMANRP